jgi:hypothetical protein
MRILLYIYINCSDANTGVIGKQQRVQNPNLAEKKERIYFEFNQLMSFDVMQR